MLSNFLPWDFLPKHPQTIDTKKPGLYAFLIDDPYLERLLLNRVPKKEIPFSIYSGVEVTRDFIEEHLVNLSLFSTTDHIQVMNAENIQATNLSFLAQAQIDWSERFMALFFTKTSKAFTEFAKYDHVQAIHVEEPRFWEGAKLWQFCQKAREITLPPDVSRFVLESLEHNFESFFWVIDTIRMNYPDGKINTAELQILVKKERWDYFELVDVYIEKPKIFFQEIIKKDIDFLWLQMLFSFMQGHLGKALFPEEIKSKGKLSKYDQVILQASERFSRQDLLASLKFFSDLEIQAKSRDELLINRLRLETLK
jgi:hypothetical protein